jgi:ferritin-like metal-binding protein YciE
LIELLELDTLKDLYIHELKDLYSAEKQLKKALPKPQFSHDVGQLVSLPATRHTMVDGRRNCPFARLWI